MGQKVKQKSTEKFESNGVEELTLAKNTNGLMNDYEAVQNAVIYPYSNGFVEGCNNRLKMIKRTMYGRARISLLRAKIIL
ncbi:transposase [Flexilinea flocculi]|uniref:transposase n=1 Tax=Flexilinea flocculi TaxID=1678840 RepID=UPI000784DFCA|nr:transposase [Flexilinea flocculi]